MLKERLSRFARDDRSVFRATAVFLALLLGLAVRLHFISGTNFPVNDGGLFYRMTSDLLANNLALPEYTSYNQDQIPFAYPPLAFYLLAALKLITTLPLLQIQRYLPLIISLLTILAYYRLAQRIARDDNLAALALVFFSLVPRGFEWFVMGGGITRGLGFLFAILALEQIWKLYSQDTGWGSIFAISLFGAGVILSHPETAIFVVYSAIAFLIYHGFSRRKFIRSLMVAAGVLVLILPWMIIVTGYHGLDPFLGAGGTGHGTWFEIRNLLTLNFGFENGYFLPVISLFSITALILRKERLPYFLAIYLILGYIIFPRSGVNLLTIAISLLAGMGFSDLLRLSTREMAPEEGDLIDTIALSAKARLIFLFIFLYLFLGAFTYKFIGQKGNVRLSQEEYEAFVWLEENSSPDDLIMFYPSPIDNRFWWNDYLAEWFPALTNRVSATTVQGYEWIPDEYDQRVYNYILLRACEDPGPDCIAAWEADNNSRLAYLVIETIELNPDFLASFLNSPDFSLIYQIEELIVFQRLN